MTVFTVPTKSFRRPRNRYTAWTLTDPPDTTRLVLDLTAGDDHAADQLLPVVYQELRSLAAALFARQPNEHTLQPTALVHEAYLKLVDQTAVQWNDRVHFFRVAAKAMRQVLVDHYRAKNSLKRGGNRTIAELVDVAGEASTAPIDLLALDEAIERLAVIDPRQAAIVELRFFGGMSVEDAARVLDVSPRTVELDWRMARAWLSRALGDES